MRMRQKIDLEKFITQLIPARSLVQLRTLVGNEDPYFEITSWVMRALLSHFSLARGAWWCGNRITFSVAWGTFAPKVAHTTVAVY